MAVRQIEKRTCDATNVTTGVRRYQIRIVEVPDDYDGPTVDLGKRGFQRLVNAINRGTSSMDARAPFDHHPGVVYRTVDKGLFNEDDEREDTEGVDGGELEGTADSDGEPDEPDEP